MFFKSISCIRNFSKMSAFIQKLNPLTGTNDWVIQSEDYDFHQEVARSSFADMLHDTERNQLYEKALKSAIDKMHSNGQKAKVLDIGTGTGLLSMMAVRNGADSVVACEAFKPMSECALKVIKRNGFHGKIKIIPKRSTELTVGENGDLLQKCNILVTEVFDTELIGEGALSTFSHAHKFLLEKECIVVPESATIYAQVVECPLAQNWNKLKNIHDDDGDLLLKVPPTIKNCAGSAAVHDIQLSQLPMTSFNVITPPVPVLRFDWSGRTPFVFQRSTVSSVQSEHDGKAQMVFMWWDLQMDTENKFTLSCAPHWAHPTAKETNGKIPWRDHWMQAVYYFPKEVDVKRGQEINVIACHDEYSLWFNVSSSLKITEVDYLNPVCECGLHVAFSRTRIGQMNDAKRNKKYLSLIENELGKESVVLVLSDGFLFGLVASKLRLKKMYFLETNFLSRRILKEFIQYNELENVEIIEDLKDVDLRDVNVVLGEPYFSSSILPWDSLLFLYLLKGVKTFLRGDVKVFPQKAVIKGVAVRFDDLHKIRSPLVQTEGFCMKDFDDLIKESSAISDEAVEAQPLWEYPGKAVSEEIEIATVNILDSSSEKVLERNGVFEIKSNIGCNGVALWVDWHLDESPKRIVTTGPLSSTEIGKNIQWDMYTRQGVYLFPTQNLDRLDFTFKFDVEEGNISMKCK